MADPAEYICRQHDGAGIFTKVKMTDNRHTLKQEKLSLNIRTTVPVGIGKQWNRSPSRAVESLSCLGDFQNLSG